MDKSIAMTFFVNAPTEMKSTPVSAMFLTVAKLTPPEASNKALPLTKLTACFNPAKSKLSNNICSAPAWKASCN